MSHSQRVPFCSAGIILAWVWDGPGAFSKWTFNFPNLCVLCVGPPPNQSLLCPDWTEGLFGPAPPPGPWWLPLCRCPPSPAPTWPSGMGDSGEDVNPLGRGTLWSPWARSCSFLVEQTSSWPPVYQTQRLIPSLPVSSSGPPATFASQALCALLRWTVRLEANPADFQEPFSYREYLLFLVFIGLRDYWLFECK